MQRRRTGHAVVVTDGGERTALAIVRSLGRAGFRVVVCSRRGHSLAGSSRYAAGDVPVPDPLLEPDAFSAAVADVVHRAGARLLLPVSDASLLATLSTRDRFANAIIPFPPLEVYAAVSDKARVMAAAASVGIATPPQIEVTSPDDDRWRNGRLRYPVVAKPARSVAGDGRQRVKMSVVHAADPNELRVALRSLPAAAFPVLVQERITGPGTGVFLLKHDGAVLASFAHERIREKPPSGGVSVTRRSVAPDQQLVERSRALLDSFGWHGVAMVEFKRDATTMVPYLMEVNARFWGSLQLALDAGVDFPRLLVETALGAPVAPVQSHRAGIVSRWTLGEVDHLLARLRGAVPNGANVPGRLRAVAEFVSAFGPGKKDEVLRLDDPLPAFVELREWFRG